VLSNIDLNQHSTTSRTHTYCNGAAATSLQLYDMISHFNTHEHDMQTDGHCTMWHCRRCAVAPPPPRRGTAAPWHCCAVAALTLYCAANLSDYTSTFNM